VSHSFSTKGKALKHDPTLVASFLNYFRNEPPVKTLVTPRNLLLSSGKVDLEPLQAASFVKSLAVDDAASLTRRLASRQAVEAVVAVDMRVAVKLAAVKTTLMSPHAALELLRSIRSVDNEYAYFVDYYGDTAAYDLIKDALNGKNEEFLECYTLVAAASDVCMRIHDFKMLSKLSFNQVARSVREAALPDLEAYLFQVASDEEFAKLLPSLKGIIHYGYAPSYKSSSSYSEHVDLAARRLAVCKDPFAVLKEQTATLKPAFCERFVTLYLDGAKDFSHRFLQVENYLHNRKVCDRLNQVTCLKCVDESMNSLLLSLALKHEDQLGEVYHSSLYTYFASRDQSFKLQLLFDRIEPSTAENLLREVLLQKVGSHKMSRTLQNLCVTILASASSSEELREQVLSTVHIGVLESKQVLGMLSSSELVRIFAALEDEYLSDQNFDWLSYVSVLEEMMSLGFEDVYVPARRILNERVRDGSLDLVPMRVLADACFSLILLLRDSSKKSFGHDLNLDSWEFLCEIYHASSSFFLFFTIVKPELFTHVSSQSAPEFLEMFKKAASVHMQTVFTDAAEVSSYEQTYANVAFEESYKFVDLLLTASQDGQAAESFTETVFEVLNDLYLYVEELGNRFLSEKILSISLEHDFVPVFAYRVALSLGAQFLLDRGSYGMLLRMLLFHHASLKFSEPLDFDVVLTLASDGYATEDFTLGDILLSAEKMQH